MERGEPEGQRLVTHAHHTSLISTTWSATGACVCSQMNGVSLPPPSPRHTHTHHRTPPPTLLWHTFASLYSLGLKRNSI